MDTRTAGDPPEDFVPREVVLTTAEIREYHEAYADWYERTQGTAGMDDAFMAGFKAGLRYQHKE